MSDNRDQKSRGPRKPGGAGKGGPRKPGGAPGRGRMDAGDAPRGKPPRAFAGKPGGGRFGDKPAGERRFGDKPAGEKRFGERPPRREFGDRGDRGRDRGDRPPRRLQSGGLKMPRGGQYSDKYLPL